MDCMVVHLRQSCLEYRCFVMQDAGSIAGGGSQSSAPSQAHCRKCKQCWCAVQPGAEVDTHPRLVAALTVLARWHSLSLPPAQTGCFAASDEHRRRRSHSLLPCLATTNDACLQEDMEQMQIQMSAHYNDQLAAGAKAQAEQLSCKDRAFEELKAHGLNAAAESSRYAHANRDLSQQAAELQQQVADLQAQLQASAGDHTTPGSPEHVGALCQHTLASSYLLAHFFSQIPCVEALGFCNSRSEACHAVQHPAASYELCGSASPVSACQLHPRPLSPAWPHATSYLCQQRLKPLRVGCMSGQLSVGVCDI